MSDVEILKQRIEKVLAEWEADLKASGVGIRGANERALISEIRKVLK